MKIFSIILILLLLPVSAFAKCSIAAICDDDGGKVAIECDGVDYDACHVEPVIGDDGKVFNQIICCNDDDKCIYILVPTNKVGM